MSSDEAPGSDPQPGVDWYTPGREAVEQGDIFFDLPLVLPESDGNGQYRVDSEGNIDVGIRDATVVVLTQTCDIPKPAQSTVLVAEVHSYDVLTAGDRNQHLLAKEYKRSLARGTAIQDFLLPPSPGGELSWSIVNFRTIHVVPKDLVMKRTGLGTAISIASPYREYLSQSFARFIMRVGLPATLDAFERHR